MNFLTKGLLTAALFTVSVCGINILHVTADIQKKDNVTTVRSQMVKDENNTSVKDEEHRPIILAHDRTVKQNDPNFDIMDGVSAYDYRGNNIT